jgi:hypothetical protein
MVRRMIMRDAPVALFPLDTATRDQMSKLHQQNSLPGPLQAEHAAGADEHLLSAREAALGLDVNPRTAQLRARRALVAGDRQVRTIAGTYCAPLWWWQRLLAKPIHAGRPQKTDTY